MLISSCDVQLFYLPFCLDPWDKCDLGSRGSLCHPGAPAVVGVCIRCMSKSAMDL